MGEGAGPGNTALVNLGAAAMDDVEMVLSAGPPSFGRDDSVAQLKLGM
jgi:hypothetical protein